MDAVEGAGCSADQAQQAVGDQQGEGGKRGENQGRGQFLAQGGQRIMAQGGQEMHRQRVAVQVARAAPG